MFKPRVREMSYDSASFDGLRFEAHYSTDTGVAFRVRTDLAGLDPAMLVSVDTDRYARLWGLAMFGHLFWPLLPVALRVNAFSLEPAEEERWRGWFLGTLSETLYRSGLPAEIDLEFSGEKLPPRIVAPDLQERAVLMSGGGKDSIVAGELLKRLGVPFVWFNSRGARTDPAVREVARLSGDVTLITGESFFEGKRPGEDGFDTAKPKRLRRFYFLHRKRLRRLRWLSSMSQIVEACLVAEATGSRYVLTGNERSSNQGNGLFVGDLEVNHQYTKSYPFEREFAPFLSKYLHPELAHASLLMPLHELQIAKLFTADPAYFAAFRSCNRRVGGVSWCLDCPKCAFVFLMMAAFLDEDEVLKIFGADLLADPKLTTTFLELCGHGRRKPFECVGTPDESLLALHMASERRTSGPLPPALSAILPTAGEAESLRARVFDAYNDENGLPASWNDRLRALL